GIGRLQKREGSNMSIICNDTQLVLLSAASQRDDHCLVPPAGPKRAQAQRAVAKLVEAGLVKEIRAKAGGPIWRRDDETGQTFALKLTAAGAKAIAVDETGPSEGEAERRPDRPIVSIDPKSEPDCAQALNMGRVPERSLWPPPLSINRPLNRWFPKCLAVRGPHFAGVVDIPMYPRDCQSRFLRHRCSYVQ